MGLGKPETRFGDVDEEPASTSVVKRYSRRVTRSDVDLIRGRRSTREFQLDSQRHGRRRQRDEGRSSRGICLLHAWNCLGTWLKCSTVHVVSSIGWVGMKRTVEVERRLTDHCQASNATSALLQSPNCQHLARCLVALSRTPVYLCLQTPRKSKGMSVSGAESIVAMQLNLAIANVGAGVVAVPPACLSIHRCCW
jgi:hypothetical protein